MLLVIVNGNEYYYNCINNKKVEEGDLLELKAYDCQLKVAVAVLSRFAMYQGVAVSLILDVGTCGNKQGRKITIFMMMVLVPTLLSCVLANYTVGVNIKFP